MSDEQKRNDSTQARACTAHPAYGRRLFCVAVRGWCSANHETGQIFIRNISQRVEAVIPVLPDEGVRWMTAWFFLKRD